MSSDLERDEQRDLLQARTVRVVRVGAARGRGVDGEVEDEKRADGNEARDRVEPAREGSGARASTAARDARP